MSAQHTPGPWQPRPQLMGPNGLTSSWVVERTNPFAVGRVERLGKDSFPTEAAALAAIANATGTARVPARCPSGTHCEGYVYCCFCGRGLTPPTTLKARQS